MKRTALLIGAQTGGLTGVDHDITSMETAVEGWGFTVTRCEGTDASRAGILDAYERLITDAGSNDAIVVYYSGHGGYARQRDVHRNSHTSLTLQYIVPTDCHESSDGDFRGIMSVELSMLLARLTERTRNVTVVLDCCHAAQMSRAGERGLIAKAQPRAVPDDIVAGHFQRLRQRNARLDLLRPSGNPWAVRIVACAPEQLAYEYVNADGVPAGMMTDALTRTLTEARMAGLRISWATVASRVRSVVISQEITQRPEAEGPAQRLLFDLEEADTIATLPVTVNGNRVSLSGATLLGVRRGDEFTVMPVDSAAVDRHNRIGDVIIDEVQGMTASGPLRPRIPGRAVPLGARAHQTRAAAPAIAVRLPAGDDACPSLAALVAASPLLRAAGPGEPCPVRVRADEAGRLTVWDRIGPLHAPHAPDAFGVKQVLRNLKQLAQADALRRLTAEPPHRLDVPVEVEFGTVERGEARPLPTSGAVLQPGQRIYLRVHNAGSTRVYVSLLDIGISARVCVLNTAAPGGHAVDPHLNYTFGWNDFTQVLQGAPLSWPPSLEPCSPRLETLLVVVTSERQDLSGLQQPGLRHAVRPARAVIGRQRSTLEELLDQLGDGRTRDISPEPGPPARYNVIAVDFELVPPAPEGWEPPR